jgi:hypothetical protein
MLRDGGGGGGGEKTPILPRRRSPGGHQPLLALVRRGRVQRAAEPKPVLVLDLPQSQHHIKKAFP